MESEEITLVCLMGQSHHRNHKGDYLEVKPKTYFFDIYNDINRDITIRKSTQCGISEYLICLSIVSAISGKSILYVLPSYLLMGKFVRDRFDKSINYTHAYKAIVKNSSFRAAESVSMKQLGNGTIFFVGSNSENSFISIPCDNIIIDEVDNCDQNNIIMAEERQSASKDKSNIYVGNPTIVNFGIDKKYKESCMKQWRIKCTHCNADIFPDFFKHVMRQVDDNNWIVIDKNWKPNGDHEARTYCQCGKSFDRFSSGEWVAEHPDIKKSGYHVSKMFSTQNTVNELITRFSAGLANDFAMQRFYNGDLGLPYVSTGAKIDFMMLDECIDYGYNMPSACHTPCIAGIDVGSVFNIIIAEPLEKRIVYIGELPVQDIAEIRDLFRQYSVRLFVIDALPETRIARQIIARNKTGFMNYYSLSKNELTISVKDNIISTNRTVCLDAVKEAIILKEFALLRTQKLFRDFLST